MNDNPAVEAFSLNISEFGILEIAIAAVLVFLFFRMLMLAIRRLIVRRQLLRFWESWLPFIEATIWFFFVIWAAKQVVDDAFWYPITVAMFSLAVLAWVAWFGLREIIAGLILKLDTPYALHDPVKLKGMDGRISRMGFRSLEIETDSGETLSLPYSQVANDMQIVPHAVETIRGFRLKLDVPKHQNLEKTTEQLRLLVLNSPWASLKKEPQIKLIEETPNHFRFEIVIYTMKQAYLEKIKSHLVDKLPDIEATSIAK